MKVTIKKIGHMEVESETELEAYALEKWFEDNMDNTVLSCIAFSLNTQKEDEQANN